MKKYSLCLCLLTSLTLMSQEYVEGVASDVVTVLSSDIVLGSQKKGCGEEGTSDLENINTYDCHCQHDESDHNSNPRALEVVPKDHVLNQKHGIKLLNISANVKAVNDNNLLSFVDMNKYGDDVGNTFGTDINAWGTLLDKKENKIRIGLDYTMRQYTMPFEGNTFLDLNTGEVNVWGRDENGSRVLISNQIREGLLDEYGERDWLNNQASLTVQALEVDMMIEPPRPDGKIGLNYGIGIGYKNLDDTSSQLGANVQDWHHNNMGIYRFEWDTFSNMIIDGRESYLTLRPQAQITFPTVEFGACRLQSNAEVSVLFNTPIYNSSGNTSLNLAEPKLSANFVMGMIPFKNDPERSVIEWQNSIMYDPMNRTPANLDPGNKAYFRSGLRFNFQVSKRTQLYVIPLEFYIPLGEQENNHILSGGDQNNQMMNHGNQQIMKKQLNNDIIGTWAQAGIVINLNK